MRLLKRHIFGGLIVLAGGLLINHFFIAHYPKEQYPPDLILPILITLIIGFGIMTGVMKTKNV